MQLKDFDCNTVDSQVARVMRWAANEGVRRKVALE